MASVMLTPRRAARIGLLVLAIVAMAAAVPIGAPAGAAPAPVVARADLGPLPVYGEFVDQQFADLVGRAPTSTERAVLVAGLRDRNLTAEAIFEQLRPTGAAVDRQASVVRLYHAFFGRLPDGAGLRYWEQRRSEGTTVAAVAAGFAFGAEFRRTYGQLDAAGFLDRVYRNVLLRAPDPGGLAFWLRWMARGAGRGTVMASFSESAEHQRRTAPASTLVLASSRMLKRPPTTAELAAVATPTSALSFGTAAAAVLRGDPYRMLHPEQVSTTQQQNVRHDGVQEVGDLPDDLTERWTVRLPLAVQRPVVAGGRVFVVDGGSNAGPGYSASVRAFDIDDGTVLWGPVDVPGSTYGTLELAFGGGRLFAMNHNAQLRAFDAATGEILWTMTRPGQSSAGRALTYADEVVYSVSYGNGTTSTFAASAADGSLVWTSAGGSIDSAPVVDGERVYLAGPGGMAFAFDRSSGARIWVRDTGLSGGGGTTAVLHDGRLYVGATQNAAVLDARTGAVLAPFTGPDLSLPAFWDGDRIQRVTSGPASNFGPIEATNEPTGAVRWSEDDDDATFRSGYVGNPVVIDGDAFVATRYGVVDRYRISDGARTWRTTVPKAAAEPEPGQINSLTIGDGLLLVQTQGQISAYG